MTVNIPSQFNPKNAQELFMADNFIGAANALSDEDRLALKLETQRVNQKDHELNVSDQAGNAGRRTTGTGAASKAETTEKKKRDKEKLEKALEIARLNQRLDEIDKELGQLYKERNQLAQEIAELNENIDVLGAAMERLQNGETLECYEDGSLEDSKLEAQVSEYERRTGKVVDRDDSESLYAVLLAQQEYAQNASQRKTQDYDRKGEQISGLENERGQVQAKIRGARNDVNAGGNEQQVERRSSLVSVNAIDDKIENLSVLEMEDDDFMDGYESYANEIDPAGAVQQAELEEPENPITNDPISTPDLGGPAL